MVTIQAPVKVNLTLEVLGRRTDGYHEVRSVIQTIGLCDTLHMEPRRRVTFRCDLPEWDPAASLVSKAIRLLREAAGREGGALVQVTKRIPLLSGLGGDSSGAASVLLGLNRLWDLQLPPQRLHDIAGRLGSDVAFFLRGGTALMQGRGEMLMPLPLQTSQWAVLVLPEVPREPGKTARAYAALEEEDFTDGSRTRRLAEALAAGGAPGDDLLHNAFDRTVLQGSEELVRCRRTMKDAGAGTAHLAGSGPALYTLAADRASAAQLVGRLRGAGLAACGAPFQAGPLLT